MANPEHVEIVKAGAKVIDEWRENNPGEEFDLEGADLKGVNLSLANLGAASLLRADLQDADLNDIFLHRANLEEANLKGAVLQRARISLTSLRAANLRGVDLLFARMFDTDLDSANLVSNFEFASLIHVTARDADLSGAIFIETLLADVDLSGASGLEMVQHDTPSMIDERTLRRSWPLPDVFLRGIGLSDELIDFARATYGKAIEFYSCFISYSSKDNDFARRLHADLQAEGVRCWFAPEDLKIGERFGRSIEDAIRLHDKLLLILSTESVQSEWVEDEVASALEKEQKAKVDGKERTVLFPIALDSAVEDTDAAWAASIRRTRHIGDFSAWKDHDAYQKAFERLLRDLKSGAKEGGNGES